MKQNMFVKTSHIFCPLCLFNVVVSLKDIICLVFQLKYMSLPISGSSPVLGT